MHIWESYGIRFQGYGLVRKITPSLVDSDALLCLVGGFPITRKIDFEMHLYESGKISKNLFQKTKEFLNQHFLAIK